MSVIHVNQIQKKIIELFGVELDLSDISLNDLQRDMKISSRCLAAFAIYCAVECTPKEAAQSVVDGGDDNGIDAIFYSPQNRRMILVQSKFSKTGEGEPDSASIGKFCIGVKDLFNLDFTRFNNKVQKKAGLIENAVTEYDTKYDLIFIDTCAKKDLAVHFNRLIDDLLNEMNNTGDDTSEQLVKFSRYNQAKVHSSLALSAGNEPIDIELGLLQWGSVNDPYKAYYGMVVATEIAEWWKNYNNRLFDRNIRQVLGQTDVNEEMERTLKDNPNSFWYFNNGITIIADKIEKSIVGGGNRDLGSFKLTNIAIVNGAQTASTIGKYALSNSDDPNIETVKVGIRLIQLSDTPENFGKEVTKANNRQNRVENRDFVSQDKVQIRIQTELAIDNIAYSIMRSEVFSSSEKSFDLIEATAALACASNKVPLAVLAKSGIGKFFEDLEKGIYKELFNESVSGYLVFNCVRITRFIEDILKSEIELLPKRVGKKYGVLIHGNRIITLLTIAHLNISNELEEINFKIEEEEVKVKIAHIVSHTLEVIEEEFPDSFLATLFKNTTKCKLIVDAVNEK